MTMAPLKIGIVLSTIREGRFGDIPADWIRELGAGHPDLDIEIVDLRDYRMPLYGDPEDTDPREPHGDAVRRWVRKMNEFDGYIFVTAEYNHSIPGPLKNALDYLDQQLHRKPAAFIGYGGVGSARAVEQLRLILCEFHMVPVRDAVHIGMDPYVAVSQKERSLDDYDFLVERATTMLDDIAWWAAALRAARIPVDSQLEESVA